MRRALCGLLAALAFSTAVMPTPAASQASTALPDTVASDCPRAMTVEPAAVQAEAVCLLRQYVQIDTTNPPGNELAAARFLAAFLQREGIEAALFEAAPGRANLYARLHGDGSGKALMLVHHMDVVPANPEEWTAPPFAGVVRDGYVWGRGTLDNKGPGIMELLSFVMLKRLGVPLGRDVVLLAVADEEEGGGKGARYMMAEHFDVLRDVEFALNEGGAMLQLDDGRLLYAVEFAQKVPLWLKIIATGPAGHAAMPKPEAATHRLVRALARLEQFEFPVTVVPAVQSVFDQRAEAMAPAKRAAYRELAKSLAQPAFRAEFLKDPHNAVMVRNSLAITMLTGSAKENVYPAQASAVVDLRLLPGQDPQAVVAELERAMHEPEVRVEPLLSATAHSSPLDTVLFKAITTLIKRHDPKARVTPNFIAGFTDCNTFRAKGITCYGFMPMHLPMAETERVHGRDERLAIDSLAQATLLLHELVREMVGR
ncbi:MAG: M20/M25/M40 family metallo-hydrolase [Gammaproteobacteria bacterium]|nr:M20/M25/M40 family metallo-hydrolase [Gammaproteobacteria bacterium]